ncbi:hypothetical protein chiPu_0024896 [Chiloscyllium punctatum]|uniref:Uncharacterized protein n=1 Tax=Chiloscyllium punctatum TaxID=137246 RepID=A0A401TDR5_CHIPU|nr:hypothetical protein [Chiloscyllium punctatum]
MYPRRRHGRAGPPPPTNRGRASPGRDVTGGRRPRLPGAPIGRPRACVTRAPREARPHPPWDQSAPPFQPRPPAGRACSVEATAAHARCPPPPPYVRHLSYWRRPLQPFPAKGSFSPPGAPSPAGGGGGCTRQFAPPTRPADPRANSGPPNP